MFQETQASRTKPGTKINDMRALDAFNHNTNLLIAGNSFAFLTENSELEEAVRGFGGRIAELSATTRVVFADQWSELLTDAIPTISTQYPLIVADLSGDMSVPGFESSYELTRPGVRAFNPAAPFYVVDCTSRHDYRGHAEARIRWAENFMPVTAAVAASIGADVRGKRIGIVLIVEPKTAVLALALHKHGAEVAVYALPHETDPDVAEYLRQHDICVFEDPIGVEELKAWKPEFLIDDGGRVIPEIQKGDRCAAVRKRQPLGFARCGIWPIAVVSMFRLLQSMMLSLRHFSIIATVRDRRAPSPLTTKPMETRGQSSDMVLSAPELPSVRGH